ncbi:ran-binding protein 3 [Condylostylus longicornis]|uniref:ran-binding protein 3 n=1 Tax=Condylostylus longicornis TaxID=2530218 RepID=UPI00244DA0D0|nr:ran-binding protein 3 [Condylostylus longicornis]
MSEIKDAPAPSSVLRPSMLRPSKFASNTSESGEASSNSGKEKTDQKSNPFLKEYQLEDENENDNNATTSDSNKDNVEKTSDPLKLLSKPNFSKMKLFTNNSMQNQDAGFVFGQNLHERVVGDNIKTQKEDSVVSDPTNSNDSSLLFTNAIQNASNNENGKEKPIETKSLTEIAREYEESRAQKRKYEEVKTITGEEDEDNVSEIDCKLFAFENGNYEERSRGILRLNDSREKENVHRVVFRTFGTLRLLVNTKVWSDMIVESPSPKSLRFTAMDNNGQIKIFLAMSRPDYITTIFNALKSRVSKLKSIKPEATDSDSSIEVNKEESKIKADKAESKDKTEPNEPNTESNGDKMLAKTGVKDKVEESENGDNDDCAEPHKKKLNIEESNK